jgi:hypothetical protein
LVTQRYRFRSREFLDILDIAQDFPDWAALAKH